MNTRSPQQKVCSPPCACLSPASRIRIAADIHRYSTSDDDSGCVMDEYAWIPSGIKPDTIHNYFAALPQNKVPFVNSAGEQWRLQQLERQLPPQDCDPRYCQQLNTSEEGELNAFEKARKEQCLGRGLIQHLPIYPDNRKLYCHECKVPINADDLVISAPERFENTFWHPKCFVCVECKELLVDLIFFKHDQNVFCGRHHAEQIKPRCSACDELIFSEECTEAEGRVWHMRHFMCWKCSCQLGGQRYIMSGETPYCLQCYHLTSKLKCNTCVKEIAADKPHITQGEVHWHADLRCFSCSVCNKNLLGKRYSFVNTKLYCGPNSCAKTVPRRTISLSTQSALTLAVNTQFKPLVSNNLPASCLSASKPTTPCSPPPQRSPPPVPSPHLTTPQENIYETVIATPSTSSPSPSTTPKTYNRLTGNGHVIPRRQRSARRRAMSPPLYCSSNQSCSSASSFDGDELKLTHRDKSRKQAPQPRSRSADGRNRHKHRHCPAQNQTKSGNIESIEKDKGQENQVGIERSQNFYSRMPPDPFQYRRSKHAYSSYSTSSSESEADAEDAYLSHYLAAASSLPRFYYENCHQKQNRTGKIGRRRQPKIMMARTAKNKSNANSNCIVS
ncbi:PET domain-containing protein [Ditylenchus destructor]|uniref:PET domain-containing protein n=1 Tax=Ditylenchus destructor TaxID=166010 RepID=A0AAD4NFP3_9BILA|nr:PET domain-containing protein [Ditylenchus destructor]